jgi:hypothetical protein
VSGALGHVAGEDVLVVVQGAGGQQPLQLREGDRSLERRYRFRQGGGRWVEEEEGRGRAGGRTMGRKESLEMAMGEGE